MLETVVALETGLPGPVVLRALTTSDVVAEHVAGDLPCSSTTSRRTASSRSAAG